jgi:hypothetical protein
MNDPMKDAPTEMELRVAKAMYLDAHEEACALAGMTIPDFAEYAGRGLWIKSARAAIRAMREPTDDVREALFAHSPYSTDLLWKLCIDAASPENKP